MCLKQTQVYISYFNSKNLSYNLRKRPSLSLSSAKSTVYGKNSIHFKGTLIWNNLPYFVKSNASLFELKRKLKTLGSINYSHLICKNYPAGIYLLKVNNRNNRTRCEICLKLTIKTPERHHCLYC